MLLKAIAENKLKLFSITSTIKKELIAKYKAKNIMSDRYTRSNIEKSYIALAISRNDKVSTMIIWYFGGTNNIFVGSTLWQKHTK